GRAASEPAGGSSDAASERPTEPLTLYRGATEEHQRGLAWTADPERAQWFAKRVDFQDDPALVYRRTFAPQDIMARFAGRGEDEFIVWIEPDDDTEQDWAT